MQPKYLANFTFVYISQKNTHFRGVNSHKPFLDIYFCPKRKNQTTFGKHHFFILYILLIFLLKEKRNTYFLETNCSNSPISISGNSTCASQKYFEYVHTNSA